MPDRRAITVSLMVGLGIAGFTVLWWHWAPAIGGGLGVLLGGLTLIGTAAVGGSQAAADAAWREAAPDLQEFGDAGPAERVPVGPEGPDRAVSP